MAGTMTGVEILRPGSFTARNGKDIEITEASLAGLAENFKADPNLPLWLGHEADQAKAKAIMRTDEPAAGWAKRLYIQGQGAAARLLADFADIPDAVAELINSGGYRKVSLGFRVSDGKYIPRHVALLGAVQPAVGGLSALPGVVFAEGMSVVTVELAEGVHVESPEEGGVSVDRKKALEVLVAAGIKASFEGVADDDVIALAEAVDGGEVLEEQAKELKEANEKLVAAVKEAEESTDRAKKEDDDDDDDDDELSDAQKALKVEADAALAELSEQRRADRTARLKTSVEQLVKDERLLPANVDDFMALAMARIDDKDMTIELSVPGQKAKAKVTGFDALIRFAEALPKKNVLGEIATEDEKPDDKRAKVVEDARKQFSENAELAEAYDRDEWVALKLDAAGLTVKDKDTE